MFVDCGEKLANALFIVGPFGRNDFRTEYLHNTSDDEIKTVVVPVMAERFISGLKVSFSFIYINIYIYMVDEINELRMRCCLVL